MNLSDLLKQDLVEQFKSDKDQVGNEMEGAGKNLASAKNMIGIEEWEWAYAAAYNAMLHAGRALMFYKGYRPKGHDHHIAVVNFTIAVFSAKFPEDVLEYFDRGRKLRHEFMYDKVDIITPDKATKMVEKSEAFVDKAKEIMRI
jgi:uncharacterized protein (UPF0332 family)